MMEIWQMLLHFDAHLPQLVAMHSVLVYAILFAVIYLQIGVLPLFFLPSNPFLFACGAVWAASQLSIGLLLIALTVAAILGSLSGYFFGKTIGQAFFIDYLNWPSPSAIDKTRAFYDKHGQKSLLFSLFVPVIRTLAPFLAGITQMHFGKFSRSAAIGAVFWVQVCVLAGYFFGNIPIIRQHLASFSVLGLGLVALFFLGTKFYKAILTKKSS